MKNKYIIKGLYVFIVLVNRKGEAFYTKIEKSSLEKVMKLNITWNPVKWPNSDKTYVQGSLRLQTRKYKTVILHRYLLDAEKGLKVDHINHDTLDNTLGNLRIADSILNGQNRESHQRDSISQVRGISWSKQNSKWIAQATVNKNNIYLGSYPYDDIEIAEKAVKEFRKRYMFRTDVDIQEVKAYAKKLKKGHAIGKNGSKYVSFHQATSKWQARVNRNGQRIYLGVYNSKSEAEQAVENYK